MIKEVKLKKTKERKKAFGSAQTRQPIASVGLFNFVEWATKVIWQNLNFGSATQITLFNAIDPNRFHGLGSMRPPFLIFIIFSISFQF